MLVGSCVLTLLLAVGTSAKALWGLQLVTDGVLGAYVLLLRSMRNPGRAARPVGRTVSVDRVGHSGHGSGLVDAGDRWVDDSWTEDPLHARWSRVANG